MAPQIRDRLSALEQKVTDMGLTNQRIEGKIDSGFQDVQKGIKEAMQFVQVVRLKQAKQGTHISIQWWFVGGITIAILGLAYKILFKG